MAAKKTLLEELFQSILHRAFKGSCEGSEI